MQQVDQIIMQLSLDRCDSVDAFTQIARALKISRGSYVAFAFGVLAFFCMILGAYPLFFSNLVGLVYPLYSTLDAIDSARQKKDIQQFRQWTTYWVILTFLVICDSGLSAALGFVPFFYVMRTVFLIYLQHPQSLGAHKVYEGIIQPLYSKYEKKIDQSLSDLNQKLAPKKGIL